ncbi:MAG: single-stranded-DNA-specific exonuclease RecJ [Spirochaetes bacterium]|nr:single-stranded-DNA-specific exonuclease RecJ [Spirochaetota bacterium]
MKIIKKELDINFIKEWMNNGINPIILSVLNRREWKNEEDLLDFFCPVIERIPSPFLFKDIITAYKRIEKAILNNEKIIVFGDRDVDGITSMVILINFLKNLGAIVEWDLPIGEDTYGLSQKKIITWENKGYSLCITVDCGITNIEEINTLKKNNIDTIIIDHHQPLSSLPDAISIINPKNENNFLFNNIAACGVTFLFIFGYLFFRSSFFDKTIAIIFKENDKIIYDVYKNLIKIKSVKLEKNEDINKNGCDYYNFYNENNHSADNLQKLISKLDIKILQPITKIYNNNFLTFLNNVPLKAKISLFNSIFKKIETFETIKRQFLPLVMLGTIADLMPLIKINRIFVYSGLEYFKNFTTPNIIKLCEQINIDPMDVTSKDIGWTICPLLNAPGRMGDASVALDFLININEDKKIIEEIICINKKRQLAGNKIYKKILNEIDNNKTYYNNNLAFFYSEEINRGITGITATKLAKHTTCPIIIAAKEGDYYTGSIRGKTDYHFVDFLNKGADILSQYGGHKKAAGFRFHKEKLDSFKNFLLNNSYLFSNEKEEDPLYIDAEIPVKYLNYKLLSILKILEPFGIDNINPILYTQSLKISSYTKMGKEKQHLKIFFETYPTPFVGIFWDKAEWFEKNHNQYSKYDVIYQLETNKYNGQIVIQMIILDLQKR